LIALASSPIVFALKKNPAPVSTFGGVGSTFRAPRIASKMAKSDRRRVPVVKAGHRRIDPVLRVVATFFALR